MEALRKLHEEIASYIPPEIRPDMTELIKESVLQMTNPTIGEYKGYRIFPPANAKKIEWQYNHWKPSSDDVLIAAYPKTGTTWMTHIVKDVIYHEDKEVAKMAKSVSGLHSYLESGTPLTFEVMEKLPWKRHIFASHIPADLINMETLQKNRCKIIYMMRNPKDQLVSLFHMIRNSPFERTEVTSPYLPKEWNAFFTAFVAELQPNEEELPSQAMKPNRPARKENEGYLHHLLTWYPYRDQDNMLCIMYEDLKRNPSKEIRRVADFLGVKRNDEEVSEVVKDTSFKTMKNEAQELFSKMNFYRKGEVGDWKNQFTVAQSELMDQKIKEKLSHTDIRFTYTL